MTASAPTAPVRQPDRFFIGGEWVEPSSDATIDVIDSGTEELYFSVAGGIDNWGMTAAKYNAN